MKELDENTVKLADYVNRHLGSLQLMFNAKGKSQEEIEESILNDFKDRVEDAWFETNEDGSRQLHIKPFPAIEKLEIKVGGTE